MKTNEEQTRPRATHHSIPAIRASLLLRFCCAVSLSLELAAHGAQAPTLTLQQAHERAMRNHPRITVADLKALAARQMVIEQRAGFFPQLSANVVAVGIAHDNTRLAAVGGLNNPAIFERNAEGLNLTQLITDFGRTANLTGSARSHALAEEDNAQATREQILLEVDAAFYGALEAQSVSRVADETVATRQLLLDQVSALASNKLRSELDVSFAAVSVEEARLLLSKGQSDVQAAFSQLTTLMGGRNQQSYKLLEEPMPSQLATNASELVEQALHSRPELLRSRKEADAALQFARAEKAARYPIISAIGSAGVVPIHDPQLPDNYAAAGLTLSLPLFEGVRYVAKQNEAELRAKAALESVRDEEDNVVRDVRIAWLNAQNAFDRLRITSQLLENASRSFDLAQARYTNGASSIVELNQAQLNKISAEITHANTKYEYLVRRSALDFQVGTLR